MVYILLKGKIKKCMKNKTGLQTVSKPVEQVPLFYGVGRGCKVLRCQGSTHRQTEKETGLKMVKMVKMTMA